ncbi:MAG: alpha/beta hydrolase-fold protein [Nocardioidaceae bacterium]
MTLTAALARIPPLAAFGLAVLVGAGSAPVLVPATPATAAPVAAARAPRHTPPPAAPPAARRPEPRLPRAAGWPFPQDGFPRTSGTGRLRGGAAYWSDFVYDDHGPSSLAGFNLPGASDLAPTQGVYTYPAGAAHQNGADLFRTAVGLDRRASYWRVDWTTLVRPGVPIAVWAFDRDQDRRTGVSAWPAGAGVHSPGIDTALVVSARGAWLLDLVHHTRRSVLRGGGRLTVDRAARSFVVRVPRTMLPVHGRWTVRVASGLANRTGRGFADPLVAGGSAPAPGATRVYNVGYRSRTQEPPVYRDGTTDGLTATFEWQAAGTPPFDQVGADGLARFVTGNFWMEDHQADALASGDVSAFRQGVDWTRLARRASTPEPAPTGYSNRWYVSALHLGQGVRTGAAQGSDLRPNYLSRIQPYAVYVPHGVPRGRSLPLTWVLHSLGVNHNQYGALDPRLLRRLCERRHSLCASTLGYGPDGWYLDEAETDYWSVWRSLARAYRLQPRRTVLTGYSMGGYAAYKLGLEHPDLYAEAVALAGPPACDSGADPDQGLPLSTDVRCTRDGATGPLVGNAHWLPYRIGQGNLDELVPFPAVEQQVQRFDARGQRYRFVRYPAEDHMVFATQDRFGTVTRGLGHPRTLRNPDRVDFSWYPHLDRPRLGLRATGAYWVRGVRARERSAGTLARVRARSFALAWPTPTPRRSGPTPVSSPLPAVVTTLRWARGPVPAARRLLTLRLTNTGRVTLDLVRAGLRCGTVRVRSDGPATVVLNRPGRASRVADVGAGTHRLHLTC